MCHFSTFRIIVQFSGQSLLHSIRKDSNTNTVRSTNLFDMALSFDEQNTIANGTKTISEKNDDGKLETLELQIDKSQLNGGASD